MTLDVQRRLERRWLSVPLAPGRLSLRSTAGRAGAAARTMYQPARWQARYAAALAGPLVRRGLGGRAECPIDGLEEAAGLAGVRLDGAAVMRSMRTDRWLIGVAEGAELRAVLKLGGIDDIRLRHEADVLALIAGRVRGFSAPEVLWAGEWNGHFLLATAAVPRARRRNAFGIETAAEVCRSLFQDCGPAGPVVHGDLAPWNVTPTGNGLALLDWEEARFEAAPLYDLAHHVTLVGALLGTYTPRQAYELLTVPNGPGCRYLAAIGCEPAAARELLAAYVARPVVAEGRVRSFRSELEELVR